MKLLSDSVFLHLHPSPFQKDTKSSRSLFYFFFAGCGIKCKEIPMELVFVIDSSESVGPENFEIIKDFVTTLVDRVTVGRNATRIGLVLYSLEVRLEFGLNKYTTQQDVKQAIRKMQYMGEGTYTATAIRKATQEGFFGARTGVRKVAIVLTDGQADKREAVKLDIAVREAHAANIEMYAIGIVNTSDPTQADFVPEVRLNITQNTAHKWHQKSNTVPTETDQQVGDNPPALTGKTGRIKKKIKNDFGTFRIRAKKKRFLLQTEIKKPKFFSPM
uniref:VWFA domain-containing protein n=1 Tax=Nothoprocta perdicaria TaxID=30464 RepID=A0A8C6YKR3_NOTPE